MLINKLLFFFIKYVKKINLERRAIESFWEIFFKYKEDDEEEFNLYFKDYEKRNMNINIRFISLQINNFPSKEYAYIIVRIDVYVDDIHTAICTIEYDLNGEYFDDYFWTF